MLRPILVFLLPALFWNVALAQKRLPIEAGQKSAFFSSGQPEEEWYQFGESTEELDIMMAEIILLAGAMDVPQILVVQSNVENVSAVVHEGRRYLLWSLDFWEQADPTMRLAALARELGHHLYEHSLSPELRAIEDPEADRFMGYVLRRKNVSPVEMQYALSPSGFMKGQNYDRMAVILGGYRHADAQLRLDALPFEEDPAWLEFQKAAFPFPPPQCYQALELPGSYFSGSKTLGEVSLRIKKALQEAQYPFRYFSVPDGFAVVTQIEQYESDGRPLKNAEHRWSELPVGATFSLSLDFFKSLVFPRKAHLRVFVFIVSKRAYASAEQRIGKEEAKAWMQRGINRLPKTVQDRSAADYNVDFLVYEFQVPEVNHKPDQKCPCLLNAGSHFRQSGIERLFRP